MGKQILITISREFGSAGHEIGEKLANKLGIKFYDRAMLDELSQMHNIEEGLIYKYDEKPKIPFVSRTVWGYSNSLEDMVYELQSSYIRSKADDGESFVLVGRCGETVLSGREGLVTVFVRGNEEEKIERVMRIYSLSREDAISKMHRHDRKRKAYHNHRSNFKWGHASGYDLCLDSSPIGVDNSVNVIAAYVNAFREQ
ncbi:MAG: cytidylate kinase-like family protein [Eubacterium sp.]|nr:cytidylate kinase-like family protein [Eubacterium sp.]